MCTAQFIVAITGTAASADNIAAQRAAIAFVCICMFFLITLVTLLCEKENEEGEENNRGVFFFFFYLIGAMLTKRGFFRHFLLRLFVGTGGVGRHR